MTNVDHLPQYGRVKGAEWFSSLYKRDVFVLGQGGIGSWVSLLLSRIGCNLHIYDMDVYEHHNMTGQLVRGKDVGKSKVIVVSDIIYTFSPDCEVVIHDQKYTKESMTNDIVICGFDNMAARKVAFDNWKANLFMFPDEKERSTHFFQDGRLLAEQLQIFSIPGDRSDLIEKYEKEYLFADEEGLEGECTFKQTTHCAAMIASHMVGFLTNWATNMMEDKAIRQVPFLYEYMIPLNLTL